MHKQDPKLALVAPCGTGTGQKPCHCCNDVSIPCSTHAECGPAAVGKRLGNVSYCGCRTGEGLCGPFGQGPVGYLGDPSLNLGSGKEHLSGGQPCQYVGEGSGKCMPAVLLTEGTAKTDIVADMQITLGALRASSAAATAAPPPSGV